jgi:glycosyltransferase involved in cell wall biosynthesis
MTAAAPYSAVAAPVTAREVFLVGNSTDALGGVTSWTHQLARLLTGRGHRVHVVGVTGSGGPSAETPYPVTTLTRRQPPPALPGGLRATADPVLRLRGRVRREVRRRQARRLTELFRAARPGAVVIVTQVWAMEWVTLADTAGLTVIGMSHESFDTCRRSSRFARVQRLYRDVDRMLVLTREDADAWIRQGMQHTGFLPNPVPFLPAADGPREEKAVVALGRLSDEKGVDMLLETWARVAPRHPDWELRVHGSGEEEERLRAQCTALGLDGSVRWCGSTDDVQGALRAGSLFVQSSRGEGFPLALMEAMAVGLPCCAFDCAPGVREIVRDGEDGLLAAPGHVEALAGHLDRLMADDALRARMGEQARRNVRRFAPEAVLDRWEELFAFLER